jgi:hypothetical protein
VLFVVVTADATASPEASSKWHPAGTTVAGLLTLATTGLVGPAGRATEDRAVKEAANVGAHDRIRARAVPADSKESIREVGLMNTSNLPSAVAADGGA